MTPHILFKFASRIRPEKFYRAIDNILEKMDDKTNYTILCTLDEDDVTMPAEMVRQKAILYPRNIISVHGKSANKIHAINRDMHLISKWDILINMSDDMMFVQHGFDNLIREDFVIGTLVKDNFTISGDGKAYDFDQFLHYNDGNQKGNVSTMAIMGRKYYDRFNYIYHPAYKSVWCDVEQTDVAVMLGKYKYMGDENVIFKHLHPAWGLAQYDDQYRASENLDVWGEDLKTIIERKRINYGITKINASKYPESDLKVWIRDLNNARSNAGMKPLIFE